MGMRDTDQNVRINSVRLLIQVNEAGLLSDEDQPQFWKFLVLENEKIGGLVSENLILGFKEDNSELATDEFMVKFSETVISILKDCHETDRKDKSSDENEKVILNADDMELKSKMIKFFDGKKQVNLFDFMGANSVGHIVGLLSVHLNELVIVIDSIPTN